MPAFVLLEITMKVTTISHSRPPAGTPLISIHTITELSCSCTLYWPWLKATSISSYIGRNPQNSHYLEKFEALQYTGQCWVFACPLRSLLVYCKTEISGRGGGGGGGGEPFLSQNIIAREGVDINFTVSMSYNGVRT